MSVITPLCTIKKSTDLEFTFLIVFGKMNLHHSTDLHDLVSFWRLAESFHRILRAVFHRDSLLLNPLVLK